jgi:L,D-peptidoglycan transpeptidase YkuD (ErfK/YbiS/YcfS/YnhG family)
MPFAFVGRAEKQLRPAGFCRCCPEHSANAYYFLAPLSEEVVMMHRAMLVGMLVPAVLVAGYGPAASGPAGPAGLARLGPQVRQALVVEAAQPGSSQGRLAAWEYGPAGWRRVLGDLAVVIGRNGFALPGAKREGDGKTPQGIYALGLTFGYADTTVGAMPYRQATAEDYWVDDPLSPQYNRWVHGRPPAASYEQLRRGDSLYKYGIVIEYNTAPVVTGLGSAIFVHVWDGPGVGTAGCVAMAESDLLAVLAWLDPTGNPVIALGEQQP